VGRFKKKDKKLGEKRKEGRYRGWVYEDRKNL